ncbi:MAG: NADH-quinone oxidoreductase subunit J [Alphaproteobacteria bacterium]|nr:MAG: NADH-quinone oxidoreductase subunit J [Alphaproteobacteria bacterium]TAF14672.1 MAG: NADH-quinone oxidoreductase subunit J [Alphaproteobacteria bacterium]TAF41265.1 MAG: NADH-quinone oxidoreductase subunit J [Alphaproteobacteria bacterium]TAF75768.1 MAG: NADH-quinone oxidoreductase subunit J [Alphaproteobacteria bacterium]
MEFSLVNMLFYLFSALVLFSAIMVISSRNPVHSVLFLIFTFFNAAGLIVLLGVEYIAMTLVIVYVGAVAVLFLFVVMMLDVDFEQWRRGFIKNIVLGIGVATLLFMQLGSIIFAAYVQSETHSILNPEATVQAQPLITNTEAIGRVLYTDYAYIFLVSGCVLLVAMIGAIVLTLRHQPNVKRQNIANQLARTRSESVDLVQVETGKGVTL